MELKRVYAASAPSDGTRVLVDRLWPRGVKKADAELELWLKDVAPSPDLRAAWHADPQGHDTEHFKAFAADYRSELGHDPAASALKQLVQLAQQSTRLTLVYGAKDEQVNHAVVLREVLLEHLRSASA